MAKSSHLPRRWHMMLGIALIALAVLAMLATDRIMRESAYREQQGIAQADAKLLATGLRSELDKFSLMPLVLSDDAQVQALLGGDARLKSALDQRLADLARQSNAAAIYVMDAQGMTLAASNADQPSSFVGSNYAFRRYFRDAIKDGSTTQFALGTVSRQPGLYVARRVGTASSPLGVVAVKIEFDALEANWHDATDGVYVTDAQGVVLLTSDPAWRFHVASSAPAIARDATADLRQFGVAKLAPLVFDGPDKSTSSVKAPLLDAQQPISPNGWSLHLLVDPGPRVANAVANGRLAIVVLITIAIVLAAGAVLMRRRREAQAEIVLAERTRTLREQLSQANRLATLGQISAGVGHEIGQPVAAARVFAESGQRLIATGETGKASDNFARIVSLTERIGEITGELRKFSKRQVGERMDIPLGAAVDGALLLLRDRIQSSAVQVSLPPAADLAVRVTAEPVRLEQVLVNLLQNALDATGDGGEIALVLELEETIALLSVCDNGPGISSDREGQLFQPFATTKADGLGIGLVISRDIMRDLGGELAYAPGSQGTCFTMTVPRAG
ncbi:sensor histidine kinase [Porphyrobacter algicida]|uniref:histidine kinase n=1 Tax=Qipengyuania algicida TaxID=1836209 RepID=A0A845AL34_9SPHN|nr:ATP-binding protein [Qipengyuania algicida]MXP29565.1 sensor histidine kinase [Qipengyuania algicida]